MNSSIVLAKTKKVLPSSPTSKVGEADFHIVSSPNYITCHLNNNTMIEWAKGSSSAHLYNEMGRIIETFSIGLDTKTPRMLDFTLALQEKVLNKEGRG